MFSQQVSYNDLGDLYLGMLNKNHLTRNLLHRLPRLGYPVTFTPPHNAAQPTRKFLVRAQQMRALWVPEASPWFRGVPHREGCRRSCRRDRALAWKRTHARNNSKGSRDGG